MRVTAVGWNASSWLLLCVLLAALIKLYSPFLETLVTAWEINPNYSHGYFIPAVSIFMIYSLRKDLAAAPVRPASLGLLLLVLGLLLLVVAKVGSEFFLQRFSLIIVLLGIVHFLFGRRYLALLAIPIFYLVFMIPLPAIIWNKIAFPMQLFSSFLTEQLIYMFGIPVYREGNVLHLADTVLEVVAACSGLRSLVTMFGLSAALAFFSNLSTVRKMVLVISAAPIAVITNIFRLTVTAALSSKYGSEIAQGFLHEFSGILIFILGLMLLMTVNRLLTE